MSHISPEEELVIASQLMAMLDDRIRRVEAARMAELSKYVELGADIQQYWYATDDNGYIATKQDAPFICDAIFLIGQKFGLSTTTPLAVSLENVGSALHQTQGFAPPVAGINATSQRITEVLQIPIEHFMPCYRAGDVLAAMPANTDYWYAPAAEWTIPKGDTLRVIFTPNVTYHPNVVLGGFKVFGLGGGLP